jgi:unsaturated rhamnogalacturonyl hydrolase
MAAATAEKQPTRKSVSRTMVRVNDYFMTRNADPTLTSDVKGKVRPSNIWTRGVYYEGLMALNTVCPEPRYVDYSLLWANFHQWGFRGGNGTRNADDLCCAQAYIDLYRLDRDARRIANVRTALDSITRSAKMDDWTWVDAIQMEMPALAKLGVETKDLRYFNKMMQMYRHTRNVQGGGLFNGEEGLWWRDKDFVPPYKEPNGANCYWSRGNGWVYAALVRCMDELSLAKKEFTGQEARAIDGMTEELMSDYMAMSRALLPYQRADGFWNCSLADSTHFGGKETTGTSLFVYGMAWGLRRGLLDKGTFLTPTLNAWKAMAKYAVHKNGFLGYVQGTGKEPKDSQPVTYDVEVDFPDFAVGCFLLGASEVYQLCDK